MPSRSSSLRGGSSLVALLLGAFAVAGHAEEPVLPLSKVPTDKVSPSIARLGAFSRDEQVGNGTGFVVRSDGILVTNHHVIDGVPGDLYAIFEGGAKYRVLGALAVDEAHDIAIIKIDATGLPALPLAKADTIEVGAPMFLLGSSSGLDRSLGTGIVSALRDDFPDEWRRRAEKHNWKLTKGPLIQHTANSAPGSSGSPIMNLAGEVIGVHHSGLTDSPIYFAAHVSSLHELLAATDLDAVPKPLVPVARNLIISAAVFAVLIGAYFVVPRIARRRKRAAA